MAPHCLRWGLWCLTILWLLYLSGVTWSSSPPQEPDTLAMRMTCCPLDVSHVPRFPGLAHVLASSCKVLSLPSPIGTIIHLSSWHTWNVATYMKSSPTPYQCWRHWSLHVSAPAPAKAHDPSILFSCTWVCLPLKTMSAYEQGWHSIYLCTLK